MRLNNKPVIISYFDTVKYFCISKKILNGFKYFKK